jgi:hypothetical protein
MSDNFVIIVYTDFILIKIYFNSKQCLIVSAVYYMKSVYWFLCKIDD